MTKPLKLTKPQREMLESLIRHGSCSFNASYKPAVRIVELGLATTKPTKFGGEWMTPTVKGRVLIAILNAGEEP